MTASNRLHPVDAAYWPGIHLTRRMTSTCRAGRHGSASHRDHRGTSFVTLSAPQLEGRRQATARVEWIDATWVCPKPVISSLEGPARLTTELFRISDKTPLVDWIVRYRFLDGPSARLGLSDDAQMVDVPTAGVGRSSIDVYPTSTASGTTRIAIEIFDPSRRSSQPIGQCTGYVTWSESAIVTPPTEFSAAEPPAYDDQPSTDPVDPPPFDSAPEPDLGSQEPETAILSVVPTRPSDLTRPLDANVGDNISYELMISNISNVQADHVLVWLLAPESGLRLETSVPAAYNDDSGRVVWDLGSLAPRQNRTITVNFTATDEADLNLIFNAQGTNTSRVDSAVRTRVVGPTLQIQLSQPQPFAPRVDNEVVFRVRVNNQTRRRLDVDLRIDQWSNGIEPILGVGGGVPDPVRGIQLPEGLAIPPGWSDWEEIPFRVVSPGAQEFRVVAEDRSTGKTVQDKGFVTTQAGPAVEFVIRGPDETIAGATEDFFVVFRNTG